MADTNVAADAAATPAQVAAPAAPLSEKAAARKAAEKALRATKVDYRTPGVTIATVAAASPKKPGSKARKVWDLYKPGMLVADLLAKAEGTNAGRSYAQACIVWDVRHGHIELALPAPKAEAPKAEAAEAAEAAE